MTQQFHLAIVQISIEGAYIELPKLLCVKRETSAFVRGEEGRILERIYDPGVGSLATVLYGVDIVGGLLTSGGV